MVKIKETIERDCCHWKDLKKYQGQQQFNRPNPLFCIHCGQVWFKYRLAGEMDDTLNRAEKSDYK